MDSPGTRPRRETYAEWYVWAAKNLTSTSEIRHACAEAATEAAESGGDPTTAARTAAQNRSGPGWTTRADPSIRSYADWYDWARTTLGLSGAQLHLAAAAALAEMERGGDAGAAADAARRAVGAEPGETPGPAPAQPPPFAPAAPIPPPPAAGMTPPPGMPPPPAMPPPPVAPPPGYGYGAPAGYPSAAPPIYAPNVGPVQVPLWVAILLGIGCGISLLIALLYTAVLFSASTDQQLQLGSGILIGLGVVMFACSLVALVGVVRRAGWARVMSIVAGAAFCLSCAGILLGVPVIVGSALARRAG